MAIFVMKVLRYECLVSHLENSMCHSTIMSSSVNLLYHSIASSRHMMAMAMLNNVSGREVIEEADGLMRNSTGGLEYFLD